MRSQSSSSAAWPLGVKMVQVCRYARGKLLTPCRREGPGRSAARAEFGAAREQGSARAQAHRGGESESRPLERRPADRHLFRRAGALPQRLEIKPALQLIGLLGWLLAAFAAAALGAIASVDAASFYAQLTKPSWAPPATVFGPVWSVLYTLMGISAWLVWRSPGPKRVALGLFGIQLAVNALWSWLFFAWHRGALATAEVFVLLVLIVATVAAFWRASRWAALLLLPYLLWVSFASVLTWTVWRNNSGLL